MYGTKANQMESRPRRELGHDTQTLPPEEGASETRRRASRRAAALLRVGETWEQATGGIVLGEPPAPPSPGPGLLHQAQPELFVPFHSTQHVLLKW